MKRVTILPAGLFSALAVIRLNGIGVLNEAPDVSKKNLGLDYTSQKRYLVKSATCALVMSDHKNGTATEWYSMHFHFTWKENIWSYVCRKYTCSRCILSCLVGMSLFVQGVQIRVSFLRVSAFLRIKCMSPKLLLQWHLASLLVLIKIFFVHFWK